MSFIIDASCRSALGLVTLQSPGTQGPDRSYSVGFPICKERGPRGAWMRRFGDGIGGYRNESIVQARAAIDASLQRLHSLVDLIEAFNGE
jgi:hypothetical protein